MGDVVTLEKLPNAQSNLRQMAQLYKCIRLVAISTLTMLYRSYRTVLRRIHVKQVCSFNHTRVYTLPTARLPRCP